MKLDIENLEIIAIFVERAYIYMHQKRIVAYELGNLNFPPKPGACHLERTTKAHIKLYAIIMKFIL